MTRISRKNSANAVIYALRALINSNDTTLIVLRWHIKLLVIMSN